MRKSVIFGTEFKAVADGNIGYIFLIGDTMWEGNDEYELFQKVGVGLKSACSIFFAKMLQLDNETYEK